MAAVLELVRLELVEQANAPPFLVEIHDDAAPFVRDHLHRGVQLPPAIASHGVEHVAREALRVHADENLFPVADVAVDERDVLARVHVIAVADDAPVLPRHLGGQARFGDAMDEPLVLEPVRHELRDGDEREVVLYREAGEAIPLHRAAVLVQDLADHAGWIEPREPCKVYRRLRVSDALEDAAVARAKWMHVPRPAKVVAHRGRVDRDLDGRRAIGGADARRHTEPRRGVDTDGEGRPEGIRVLIALRREAELIDPLTRERKADHPFRLHHEVDERRRDELRRANEVTLVLAVLVVSDDDELSGANVGDRLGYRSELHRESGIGNGESGAARADPLSFHGCMNLRTYLPMTSPSTCTRSAARSAPSVVCRNVYSINESCTTPGSGTAFTVRLTPSTVIEPCGTSSSATLPGTSMSTRTASSNRRTARTVPTPSTWPCTMWPPSRSDARSARSRFTRVPTVQPSIVVRPSVVATAATVKHPDPRSRTVKHAPFTATLSPSTKSSYPERMRNSRPAGVSATWSIVPTSSTRPVNIQIGWRAYTVMRSSSSSTRRTTGSRRAPAAAVGGALSNPGSAPAPSTT